MKFIKLTGVIINTNYISKILIQPNKFCIYLTTNKINGVMFVGSGSVYSEEEGVNVCAKNNSIDYKIVQEWIDKLM